MLNYLVSIIFYALEQFSCYIINFSHKLKIIIRCHVKINKDYIILISNFVNNSSFLRQKKTIIKNKSINLNTRSVQTMPTFVIVCFSYREFVIIFNQLNIKWRYFNGNLNLNATYFYKKESF